MSIYGNIINENSESLSDICNEIYKIELENKNFDLFYREFISESNLELLNEGKLDNLKKKIQKKKELFSKRKTKMIKFFKTFKTNFKKATRFKNQEELNQEAFKKIKIDAYYDYYSYLKEIESKISDFDLVFRKYVKDVESLIAISKRNKKVDGAKFAKLNKILPDFDEIDKTVEPKEILPKGSTLYDLLQLDQNTLNKNLFGEDAAKLSDTIENYLNDFNEIGMDLEDKIDDLIDSIDNISSKDSNILSKLSSDIDDIYYEHCIWDESKIFTRISAFESNRERILLSYKKVMDRIRASKKDEVVKDSNKNYNKYKYLYDIKANPS